MSAGLNSQSATITAETPHVIPDPADLAKHFPSLEILEVIGRGGMGIVYKARQRQLDRIVALKILPPEISRDASFSERFAREARALAKLNHPNIVSIYDSGQSGGLFYFLMEYVDGTNLRQALRGNQISPREALAIVPLICDALQYAHDMGIVHRDIKPENVLLDRNGRVKIADFGLAKLVKAGTSDSSLTLAGSTMGTPKYMAPEQMEHPGEVDHRADIYSLGVVFYEMLTGELPVGRFALPSQKVQVDVRLDEVVLRTLEQKPERRYQKASEIKSEVETITGYFDKLPPSVRDAIGGFEYRSKLTLFGWPLVHVAHGIDPRTGKRRVAKGIFAQGSRAIGLVAIGGRAIGVLAFGRFAIGVFALGALAIGALSSGGMALALILGWGGAVAAPLAFGGVGLGWWVLAGIPFGVHANDGEAMRVLGWGFRAAPLYWLGAFAVFIVVSWMLQIRAKRLSRK
jgi:tRNA A-37 threonylcarbamoyl transferase component Bud32